MIIRLSILVAASIVALTVKQIITSSFKSQSTPIKPSESDDINEDEEEGEEEEEEKEEEEETELECLLSQVNEMMEREEMVERELLVYYGLEQQEMEIIELKKNLNTKLVEIDKLSKIIDSVKVQNMALQEEIRRHGLAKKQLEKAKTEIRNLEQLVVLKERIASFQKDEEPKKDREIQRKIEAGEGLEWEVMKLKRKHNELQLERRILAFKVIVAEARVTSISKMTQNEVMSKIRTTANASRLVNEELLKQVERLQKDRFDVVEELVYQRWVNACLRHNIKNCQTPSRKSSIMKRKDVFDTCKDKPSKAKSTSFVHKLKKWRRSIDSSSVVSSIKGSFGSSSRRSSSSESHSYGSFGASSLKNVRGRVAITTPRKSARRVSFNDSLNTTKTSPETVSMLFGDIDDMYPAHKDCCEKVTETERPTTEKTDEVRIEKSINGSSVSTIIPSDLVEEIVPTMLISNNITINKAQNEMVYFNVICVFFLILGLLYYWLGKLGIC